MGAEGFQALPALLLSTSIYNERARKSGRAPGYSDSSVKWGLGQPLLTCTMWDHLEQGPAQREGELWPTCVLTQTLLLTCHVILSKFPISLRSSSLTCKTGIAVSPSWCGCENQSTVGHVVKAQPIVTILNRICTPAPKLPPAPSHPLPGDLDRLWPNSVIMCFFFLGK